MKNIKLGPDVYKKLQSIRKKDKKLYKKVQKQLTIFQKNSRHSSLRLHRIIREVKNVWSISINKSYRMLYVDEENMYYFFDIGTHDEVYKK